MGHYTNPEGREYITGMNRTYHNEADACATHLYDGDFSDPGLPLCKWGWNRDEGQSYSIWRGNVSKRGICKICKRRADKGLDGVKGNWTEEDEDDFIPFKDQKKADEYYKIVNEVTPMGLLLREQFKEDVLKSNLEWKKEYEE